MKRICSVILVMVFALSGLPIRGSAKSSVPQRIADIRAEYGINVVYDRSVESAVPAYLDNVEAALKILGPVFTKQMVKSLWRRDRTFRLEIVAFPSNESREWVDALYSYDTAWDTEQVLSLYVKAEKKVTTSTVIHEFGHLLHNCVGYDEFVEINGGRTSYQSPVYKTNRYVSQYAMMDDCEDFAETFAAMATKNNGAVKQLAKLDVNSPLYRKYAYVFQSIRSFCGDNSRLTVSAAEFLGIDM